MSVIIPLGPSAARVPALNPLPNRTRAPAFQIPRSRILRNNQSDNQSDIAQPAAHNATAAHTIHSSYKRHTISIHSSTQTAIVHTSQHTIRMYSQPAHNQDAQPVHISMHSQHAPGSTRLPDSSNDAPYFAVVLRTYSSCVHAYTTS